MKNGERGVGRGEAMGDRGSYLDAAPVRTRAELLASLWIGTLTVAGVALTTGAPAAVLRSYPLTFFTTAVGLALGAVAAEGMWNARPWRHRALLWSVLISADPVISRALDRWLRGTVEPFPLAVGILRFVLTGSLVFLMMSYVTSAARVSVHRPSPSDRPPV